MSDENRSPTEQYLADQARRGDPNAPQPQPQPVPEDQKAVFPPVIPDNLPPNVKPVSTQGVPAESVRRGDEAFFTQEADSRSVREGAFPISQGDDVYRQQRAQQEEHLRTQQIGPPAQTEEQQRLGNVPPVRAAQPSISAATQEELKAGKEATARAQKAYDDAKERMTINDEEEERMKREAQIRLAEQGNPQTR